MSRYRKSAGIVAMLLLCGAAPAPADDAQGGGHGPDSRAHLIQTNAAFWLGAIKDQCDPAHDVRPDLVVTWSGACTDKLLDGPGTLVLSDRANQHRLTMTALFVRGVAEGPQAMTFPDGNVFEGIFHNDSPNGHGRMRFPDGSSIEGEFRDDLLQGKSHAIGTDGSVTDAIYRDGVLNGPWTKLSPGGFRTDAIYRENLLNGPSVTTFGDGSSLAFNYRRGVEDADATYVDTSGRRLVGPYLPAKLDKTKMQKIEYFTGMLQPDMGGTLRVELVVAPDGHVASVALSKPSGVKVVNDVLAAAAATWVYQPATIGGQPIASHATVLIRRGDSKLKFDEAIEK